MTEFIAKICADKNNMYKTASPARYSDTLSLCTNKHFYLDNHSVPENIYMLCLDDPLVVTLTDSQSKIFLR